MKSSSDITIDMYGRMMIALEHLETCREFAPLIPEVRTNMVYARPGARTPEEVLAIEGRITVIGGMPRATGRPHFGASGHMARLILGIMDVHPGMRTAIDFSNTPDLTRWLEDYCRKKDWAFAIIDRAAEPGISRDAEGSTMSWKAREAIRIAGERAPKVFCDPGSFGKEPVSVIMGPEPVSTSQDLCGIAREYARRSH
ncbi:MAG: thiamine-phosphate synthase family protein [Methanoregula sp.]|nr:thiamine-phosphate synthase family protein [Methanoregula sp.]